MFSFAAWDAVNGWQYLTQQTIGMNGKNFIADAGPCHHSRLPGPDSYFPKQGFRRTISFSVHRYSDNHRQITLWTFCVSNRKLSTSKNIVLRKPSNMESHLLMTSSPLVTMEQEPLYAPGVLAANRYKMICQRISQEPTRHLWQQIPTPDRSIPRHGNW